jgi:DNA repair protein RadA/Sms
MGRCPRCGEWGTMELLANLTAKASRNSASPEHSDSAPVVQLSAVNPEHSRRHTSGIAEVDRVLGGGWVSGTVLLLAGEPGIGKSTLLLQLSDFATKAGRKTLYVAGEESLSQVKLRADRIGVKSDLPITREISAHGLANHFHLHSPDLVIVDSIQSVLADINNTPGSLTQVREATAILTQAAKSTNTTLVLIGHVTKQGDIAGPKVIEHMVDATLSLESAATFKILRTVKNRFGPAGEVGVFEMVSEGLIEIANPSKAFLAERRSDVPGSVVLAALEGQRSLLVEVQALASKSPHPSPRRVVQGLDQRRVDVVLAVLERRVGLPLAGLDIFINVAGGLRLTDPGADLAVALATYSAVMGRPLPEKTAVVGEVGLAGEVRSVNQMPRRNREAERSGYPRLIGPASQSGETKGVRSITEALSLAWGDAVIENGE